MDHCLYRRAVLRRAAQERAPNEVVCILLLLKVSVFGNAMAAHPISDVPVRDTEAFQGYCARAAESKPGYHAVWMA